MKTIIYMRNVPGLPKMRMLTKPLACVNKAGETEYIPTGFMWDGSSVPWIFQGIFPRHRHPVASCRHDYRCGQAKNPDERAFADKEFKKDVEKDSWMITAVAGYVGVRVGAFFGIGSNF